MWRFRPFWFLRALPQMSHFTDSTFVGISGICAGVASLILSASRTLRYCWRKLSWYFCWLHFWVAKGNFFLVLVVSRVLNVFFHQIWLCLSFFWFQCSIIWGQRTIFWFQIFNYLVLFYIIFKYIFWWWIFFFWFRFFIGSKKITFGAETIILVPI